MQLEGLVRKTLLLSAVFNLVCAGIVIFPNSALGQLTGFPAGAPAIYAGLLAWLVTVYAGAYAWLGLTPVISRPLLYSGVCAKGGAFLFLTGLWLAGGITAMTASLGVGDLLFAAIWYLWLNATKGNATTLAAAN